MSESKSKTVKRQIDRIVLHSETGDRLNHWMEELCARYKGLRLSRNDLANHLLMSLAATLTTEQAEGIRDRYFDQVSFAAWVLKEARAAKARGEAVSLPDLYEGISQAPKTRRGRKPLSSKRSDESSRPESAVANGEAESGVL